MPKLPKAIPDPRQIAWQVGLLLGCVGLLVGNLCGGQKLDRQNERLLLARSTQIVDMQALHHGSVLIGSSAWLSDQEAVFTLLVTMSSHQATFLYDTRSAKVTPLPALLRQQGTFGKGPILNFSENGRWADFQPNDFNTITRQTKNGFPRWVTRLDGSGRFGWMVPRRLVANGIRWSPQSYCLWMNDDQHIADLFTSALDAKHSRLRLHIHDVQTGRLTHQNLLLPITNLDLCSVEFASAEQLLLTAWDMRAPEGTPPNTPVTQYVLSLKKPPAPPQQWTYSLPPDSFPLECAYAPDRKRLAWTLVRPHGLPTGTTREIWVCNLDGSHMRQIAMQPIEDNVRVIHLFPQWLPDGKHLSFRFEDSIYTVPVN